jgi:hypothetical protein
MNGACDLLTEIARIGAAIQPAGERLILRAGSVAIPANLITRIRAAKYDLISVLRMQPQRTPRDLMESPRRMEGIDSDARQCCSLEHSVVRWLDRHPAPSPPGRCAWCGKRESLDARIVPFGAEPGPHTWLHSHCWPDWHRRRRSEAMTALERSD